MKKLFLLFAIVFATDSFATGIGNVASAPCTNNTLETYSGNTNLQADWAPNTINIRWYNNNTLMTVQEAANTCTYDDVLNVPSTAPTRVGYTFDGWTVRPEINFATIPTNVSGTQRWAIGWSGKSNYCWYDTNTGSAWNVNCNSDSTYANELQTHEWKVHYEHGDLYGMAGCSTTSGTYATPGNPTIGTGQYCWCKATGYKATNANAVSGPLSALSWVFFHDRNSVTACAQNCAPNCASRAGLTPDFRTALFTPAQ